MTTRSVGCLLVVLTEPIIEPHLWISHVLIGRTETPACRTSTAGAEMHERESAEAIATVKTSSPGTA